MSNTEVLTVLADGHFVGPEACYIQRPIYSFETADGIEVPAIYLDGLTDRAVSSVDWLRQVTRRDGGLFDTSKDQPYETYVYDELYRRGRYSGREWSGNSGNAPVRLNLIPSRVDGEISNRTVEQQVRMLRERQASRPELQARVPSLLDAVTYWYTLRAQGDKLDDSSAFDKTYIRHFDLEPKTVDRWSIVPGSYVSNGGKPTLYCSYADYDDGVRLAVG